MDQRSLATAESQSSLHHYSMMEFLIQWAIWKLKAHFLMCLHSLHYKAIKDMLDILIIRDVYAMAYVLNIASYNYIFCIPNKGF